MRWSQGRIFRRVGLRDVSRVPLAVHKECTMGTEWEQANQESGCCDSLMGDNGSGQSQGDLEEAEMCMC